MMSQQACAAMFVDLAGSTGAYERLGDNAAKELVDGCLTRLSGQAEVEQGVVIKTIGDELMLRFPSADCAAKAALAMQTQNRQVQSPFSLRIGFHYGPVLIEQNDIFGDAVNTAARLTQMARNDQILTSEDSVQRLDLERRHLARNFEFERLRGKMQATRIYELLWESERDVTKRIDSRAITTEHGQHDSARSIRLSLRGKERQLRPDDVPITLGRETGCTLVIASEFASRVHAQIDYRRGKFILTDRSTNGSFVTPGGGHEVYLKGESLPLSDSGIISLGSTLLQQTGSVLRYQID